MTEPTVAVRVLDELRRSGIALDDDEVARRLGVSPRQTINQVCRRLESAGRLRRYVGSAGKVVRDLRLADGQSAVATASARGPIRDHRRSRRSTRCWPTPQAAARRRWPAGRASSGVVPVRSGSRSPLHHRTILGGPCPSYLRHRHRRGRTTRRPPRRSPCRPTAPISVATPRRSTPCHAEKRSRYWRAFSSCGLAQACVMLSSKGGSSCPL
jgi:hypothetical protein